MCEINCASVVLYSSYYVNLQRHKHCETAKRKILIQELSVNNRGLSVTANLGHSFCTSDPFLYLIKNIYYGQGKFHKYIFEQPLLIGDQEAAIRYNCMIHVCLLTT